MLNALGPRVSTGDSLVIMLGFAALICFVLVVGTVLGDWSHYRNKVRAARHALVEYLEPSRTTSVRGGHMNDDNRPRPRPSATEAARLDALRRQPKIAPWHLHLGVAPANLAFAMRTSKQYFDDHRVILDGDGWNVWGQPVGADGNDALTLHVIVPMYDDNESTARASAERLVLLLADRLVPMTSEHGEEGEEPDEPVAVLSMGTSNGASPWRWDAEGQAHYNERWVSEIE